MTDEAMGLDGPSVRPEQSAIALPIRNAVRALVLHDGQVLLLRKHYPDQGDRHALPGGGQEPGELLHESLQRECVEEIGTTVEIVALNQVAEVFRKRERNGGQYRHQVEFIFLCRVPSTYQARSGAKPDRHQVAVEWVGLQHLDHLDMRPYGTAGLIRRAMLDLEAAYVGLV